MNTGRQSEVLRGTQSCLVSKGTSRSWPRLLVAGLCGDSGKTLVSLGLIRAFRNLGRSVAAFKKGPDFIDAAWLSRSSGEIARNLDTFLMPPEAIHRCMARAAAKFDVAVIEGNRGIFDGLDAQGSHSSAELAKLTRTPVVLVVDTTKVTRTVSALVKGCQALDPELPLVGVILNRVGTLRQENLIRKALWEDTGLPVVGAVPRLALQNLPSRHLGLVTAIEHPETEATLERLGEVAAEHLDLIALFNLARTAAALPVSPNSRPIAKGYRPSKIGVLWDKAFSFYYPENLEALEEAGAELIRISPLEDSRLPEIDALYAGGGFPEVYAKQLSENDALRSALLKRIEAGLPVWAECGGLIYLSKFLVVGGKKYSMVGALPVTTEQTERPQGHGYVEGCIDRSNLFFQEGVHLSGHEFHYSRVRTEDGDSAGVETILALQRGTGVGKGRDGILARSVVASYTHLHALGSPGWADGLVNAASWRAN